MKAMVRERYGPPEILELREVDMPELTDDGVLVRVHASSVNRADWYMQVGPWVARLGAGLRRPKERVPGTDFAGVVEAVGKDVTDFKPGDEVFGGRSAAFAEYVNARKTVALKPTNVTFEEAAAAPLAALTALQGLRKAELQPGQTVLVNGASGGVGGFGVQVAKALGAGKVTAVCSTRNVEQARSLGADEVIDYTRDDFTRAGERYDVLFDNAGTRPWSELKRVLNPDGRQLMVGLPMLTSARGLIGHMAGVRIASVGSGRKVVFFITKGNRADMNTLRDLIQSGQVKPLVERTYPLSEAPEALRYMGTGHVRSKLVITI
ncbi:MAG: NAD(P)-dependent alcohol dehydrogenase [Gaiellaceae bacterium]